MAHMNDIQQRLTDLRVNLATDDPRYTRVRLASVAMIFAGIAIIVWINS